MLFRILGLLSIETSSFSTMLSGSFVPCFSWTPCDPRGRSGAERSNCLVFACAPAGRVYCIRLLSKCLRDARSFISLVTFLVGMLTQSILLIFHSTLFVLFFLIFSFFLFSKLMYCFPLYSLSFQKRFSFRFSRFPINVF